MSQLEATTLDFSEHHGLTMLPDALGLLPVLSLLMIRDCPALTRLPLSFAFLPGDTCLCIDQVPLVFPPCGDGDLQAIRMFLLAHHHPLKILLLVLGAHRRRIRHPPPEL